MMIHREHSSPDQPVPVKLPLSKSISNRMLILRHLAGSSLPIELSDSNDTKILHQLLHDLSIEEGLDVYNAEDAGTVFRFLAAVLAITPGQHLLTGTPRMLERPVKPLVDALIGLGADITYPLKSGFPPLLINGRKLKGGSTRLDASLSSQFASALMMIAPALEQGLKIELSGRIVSEPYLELTVFLMKLQGYQVEKVRNIISVKPDTLRFNHNYAEGDWSAASYWYGLVALSGNISIEFQNLHINSAQGDSCLPELFAPLGISSAWQEGRLHIRKQHPPIQHFEADFTACPDLLPAVAVCCAGLGIGATLTGISTLRLKESDRIDVLCENLNRLGFQALNLPDQLKIIPTQSTVDHKVVVNTRGDHRMAMSFAMLAAVNKKVVIDDPSVVAKSYPDFWVHLQKAGFKMS